MPHGKDQFPATNRGRARQHGVGRYAGQPFVDDMLVGLASAECLRIAGAGIAIERLHEDQVHAGSSSPGSGGTVKRSIEEALQVHGDPMSSIPSSGRSKSVV